MSTLQVVPEDDKEFMTFVLKYITIMLGSREKTDEGEEMAKHIFRVGCRTIEAAITERIGAKNPARTNGNSGTIKSDKIVGNAADLN